LSEELIPNLNFKMHVCYTLTQPGFVVRLSRLLPHLGTTYYLLREKERKERERERERECELFHGT
jgi:cation transport regulator ChaC